jgi:hypothetical protein
MKAREVGTRLLAGFTLVFAIGAMWGLFELALRLLQGRGLPRWSILAYIGVAFALGLAYFLAEALWYPIGRVLVDPDKITDPLWKRSLRLVTLLAIIGAVMAGGILAEKSGWLPIGRAW